MGGRSAHSPVGRAVQRGLRSSMGRAVEGAEPSRAEPIFFSSPPPPHAASCFPRRPPAAPGAARLERDSPGAGPGRAGPRRGRRTTEGGGGNGRLAPSPPPLSEEGR